MPPRTRTKPAARPARARGPAPPEAARPAGPHALPAEFDPAIYAAGDDPALAGLDPAQLRAHYDRLGREAGRRASAIGGRRDFLALLPADGPVLEIGPFCTPASLPGRAAPVRYLDILPTEALRATTAGFEWADPDQVPEIDYVWHGEPYRALIGERFDAVLSSHCIEHQPCLITHLTDLASVLRPGGRVFLVVPDKRYCFDHFLPASSLADVLEAYAERRTRIAPRAVLAARLMITHNDPVQHWRGAHGEGPWQRSAGADLAERISTALREARAGAPAFDVHAWQFVPASFRHLIGTLAATGLSPLRLERLYPTLRDSNEFHAVLRVAA